jgi:predicted enzyme related to lactoylglutathione lyase
VRAGPGAPKSPILWVRWLRRAPPRTNGSNGGANRLGSMALRFVQVNFKARDDEAVGRFWAEALGWTMSSEGPGVTNLEPTALADSDAFGVDIVSVPDVQSVKYRAHLELRTTSVAHRAQLVARLMELGATSVDHGKLTAPGTVLADPEGNVFSVLEPQSLYRDTGPIAAVVVACTDPPTMARFWSEATDWTVHELAEERATMRAASGIGPYLEFARSPDLEAVRTRIHLDLRPYPGDGQAAEVARLHALGAADADIGQGDVPWAVLTDPEGNEFCVLTPG